MKKFFHWFTNVYWYHYKLHTAVAVILVIFAVAVVRTVVFRADPDITVVVASEERFITDEQCEELTAYLTGQVRTENGMAYSRLNLGGESDYAIAQWQVFILTLVDEQCALFIVGESLLPSFTEHLDGFYAADEIGFSPSADIPQAIRLGNNRLLEELSLGDEPMYAFVKRTRMERDGSFKPENEHITQIALQSLSAVLGY